MLRIVATSRFRLPRLRGLLFRAACLLAFASALAACSSPGASTNVVPRESMAPAAITATTSPDAGTGTDTDTDTDTDSTVPSTQPSPSTGASDLLRHPPPPDDSPPMPPTARVVPCESPQRTPAPLRGGAASLSQTLLEAVVCSSTDVVVTTSESTGGDALRAANHMGAPLVYSTVEAPYDPTAIGVARVWTNDPNLVVPGDHALLPLPLIKPEASSLVVSASAAAEPQTVPGGVLQTAVGQESLIVVSANRPEMAAASGTIARSVGGAAIWATPGDMRNRPVIEDSVRTSARRLLVGDFPSDAAWQIDVAARGLALPGGGQLLFPSKRIVALYGHPHTAALGVLGEQSPEAAVRRAAEVAESYATEGIDLVPGFEIITTLASASAGADGDYSAELSVADLTPWVNAATEAGYYVILDLQPGRTDFLTQAKRYEELLSLPNVGLALDPEWRLKADQTHLRQIGSVTAREINEVSEWLAGIVRREALPQKLLLVHQFKLSMISSRSEIESRPELGMVIQMDGQGPLGTKFATWRALLVDGSPNWEWGWKSFYDEDSPMATPQQVLDLEPVPVFISFQ